MDTKRPIVVGEASSETDAPLDDPCFTHISHHQDLEAGDADAGLGCEQSSKDAELLRLQGKVLASATAGPEAITEPPATIPLSEPGAFHAIPLGRAPVDSYFDDDALSSSSAAAYDPATASEDQRPEDRVIHAELVADDDPLTTIGPQHSSNDAPDEQEEIYKAEALDTCASWVRIVLFSRPMLLAVLVIIGVSAVAGGISATLVGRPGETAAVVPTAAPVVVIQDLVQSLYEGDDEEALLRTPESPQHRAMQWLLASHPPDSEPLLSESRLLTRYALAVLYYATDGDQWTNRLGFLDPVRHECDWNAGIEEVGVLCDFVGNVRGVSFVNNHLRGTLPSEMGLLNKLTILLLRGDHGNIILHPNTIHGTLPTEIGAMTDLVQLDLSVNKLSGTLPSEIGLLTNLVELHLYNNFFTGIVPATMGNMTSLTVVDLQSNRLTGVGQGAFDHVACVEVSTNLLDFCPLERRRLQAGGCSYDDCCMRHYPPCGLP